MSVFETPESKTIAMRMWTGTSASGVKQYKSVNLPPINPTAEPTNLKIWAVTSAITPLLKNTVEEVVKTYKSTLKDEE